MSAEGKPLSGIEIRCDFGEGFEEPFPPVMSDAQGRFRRDLPAGGSIGLFAGRCRLPKLTVAAGEQIELGDITLESTGKRPRDVKATFGPPKRTKATAVKPPIASAPASASGQIAKTRITSD